MRGVRSTLVLFVLAVGLGGYAYFIEGERPAAPSEAPLGETARFAQYDAMVRQVPTVT